MTVPKRRQSKMKGRQRRTHYTAVSPTLSTCPKCRNTIVPHMACPFCGNYRGRLIFTPKSKKSRDAKRGAEAVS